MIIHRPITDTEKVKQHYSEKDSVPIEYVCTSSLSEHGEFASDIFFRGTPHPEFGNRYFTIFRDRFGSLMIAGADQIEKLTFNMIEVDGCLHYSQHRHDFHCIGPVCIDGGRSYLRLVGSINLPSKKMRVVDGLFVDCD